MPAVHSTINARKRKKDNGLFPTSIIDGLLDILLMLLIMHLGEPLFDDEAHEKPDKAEEKCPADSEKYCRIAPKWEFAYGKQRCNENRSNHKDA